MSRRRVGLTQVIAWVEAADKDALRAAGQNISAVIQRALKNEADRVRSKKREQK